MERLIEKLQGRTYPSTCLLICSYRLTCYTSWRQRDANVGPSRFHTIRFFCVAICRRERMEAEHQVRPSLGLAAWDHSACLSHSCSRLNRMVPQVSGQCAWCMHDHLWGLTCLLRENVVEWGWLTLLEPCVFCLQRSPWVSTITLKVIFCCCFLFAFCARGALYEWRVNMRACFSLVLVCWGDE